MKKIFFGLFLFVFAITYSFNSLGQSVGIGETSFEPSESAALEIRATQKGILIPKLTDQQRNNISNPVEGLLIYQVNLVTGFYYFNGSSWERLGSFYVDYDTDSLNEIQSISISNDTIYLQNGGFVKLPQDLVDDADADSLNEIQTLLFSNDTLQISKGNKTNLSSLKDNLGNHILTQNLQLNGFSVGNDSVPSFYIDSVGNLVFLKGTSIENNFTIEDTLIVNSSVYLNQRVYINQDDPDHTNLPAQVPDELTVVGDTRFYDDNVGYANPDFARITFDDLSSGLNDGRLNFYSTESFEFGRITQSSQTNGVSLLKINGDGSLKISNQYTLPNSDGNANQMLTSDGNGNISWKSVGENDTVSVESGSFIAFPGFEYLLDGNFNITITLPDAANNKGKKIIFYAYQYDAVSGFFFDVATNSTSIFSVQDNATYSATNEFGVTSPDKVVTLISNGISWVMLGAKD
jgi:hypothetical protein